MVKIQIYTTFRPCHSENLDLHNIYIMLWWKVRFLPCCGEKSDLHHTVVESQIFTTPWWKVRFTPYCSENLDIHNIYITPWWKVRFSLCHDEKSDLHHAMVKSQIYTTFSLHMLEFSWQNLHHNVVKIDFHYNIYTTCGENYQCNVVITFSVIFKIGPTSDVSTTTEDISVCGENYLTMPSGVEKIDTNAASSVLLELSYTYYKKIINTISFWTHCDCL